MLHMFKRIISPGIFSFFQNLDFPGFQEGKIAKNGYHLIPQEPYNDPHVWYTCVKG